MGKLYLHIDAEHTAFIDAMIEKAVTFEREGKFDSFMMIVPTNRWARELRRLILERSSCSCISAPFIMGYNEAIDLFYSRLVRAPLSPVLDIERLILAVSTIKSALAEEPLNSHPISTMPISSVVEEELSLIENIKSAGFSPQDIDRLLTIDSKNASHYRLYIFSMIFREYERYLSRSNRIDFPGKVGAVGEMLNREDALSNRFICGLRVCALSGFDLFSRGMYAFIEGLVSHIPEVDVLIEYDESRPWIFEHLREPMDILSGIAERVTVRSNTATKADTVGMHHLFFTKEKGIEKPPQEYAARIYSLEAAEPAEEVEFICRYIKRTLLENPEADPSNICICIPEIERYSPLIRWLFPQYGIPFNILHAEKLSETHFFQTLRLLLKMVARRYERLSVIRFYQAPYTNITLQEIRDDVLSVNTNLLLTVANQQLVVDGKDAWDTAFIDQQKMITAMTEDSDKTEYVGDGTIYTEEDALYEAEQLKLLKTKLFTLFNIVSPLETPQTISSFARHLLEVVNTLSIVKRVEGFCRQDVKDNATGETGKDFCARELEGITSFDTLMTIISDLDETIDEGRLYSIVEFSQFFEYFADTQTVHHRASRAGAVGIMGKLDLRGLRYERIIFAGMTESAFPRPFKPAQLLTDTERQVLKIQPSGQYPLSKDLFIFYSYLQQVDEEIIISYPRSIDQKRQLPSMILEELARISTVTPLSIPADACFYSLRGVHKYLGSSLRQDYRGLEEKNIQAYLDFVDTRIPPQCAPSHIKEALRMTYFRDMKDMYTEYDGIITQTDVLRYLDLKSRKPFSVSRLEQYGSCPFAFFCKHLLRMESITEFDEEISALIRGTLIHTVLFKFYNEWIEGGNGGIDSEQKMSKALASLLIIASKEIGNLAYSGSFWDVEIESMFGSAEYGIPGIFNAFVNIENARFKFADSRSYLPRFFEVAFGSPPGRQHSGTISMSEPFILNHKGETVTLRGRIDRIDISKKGFLIIDYKSSKSVPDMYDLKDGLSLQLPVYALVAQHLLCRDSGNPADCHGLVYFKVRDGVNCEMSNFLTPEEYQDILKHIMNRKRISKGFVDNFNEYISMAQDFIVDYIRGIRSGHFAVREVGTWDRCENCDFNKICRADFRYIPKRGESSDGGAELG